MDFDNRKVYGDTSITDGLVRNDKLHSGLFGNREKHLAKKIAESGHMVNSFPMNLIDCVTRAQLTYKELAK